MGLRVALVAAGGTLKDQGVLAEFIAELEDLKFCHHPRFLTDDRTSVHPVLVLAQHCIDLTQGISGSCTDVVSAVAESQWQIPDRGARRDDWPTIRLLPSHWETCTSSASQILFL
jgi:hypothetical protein